MTLDIYQSGLFATSQHLRGNYRSHESILAVSSSLFFQYNAQLIRIVFAFATGKPPTPPSTPILTTRASTLRPTGVVHPYFPQQPGAVRP